MADTEIKDRKLSTEELSELTTGLSNFGDMLVMMGKLAKLEKDLSGLDVLMKRLFQPANRDFFMVMEANPELMDKASALMMKWKVLEDKDPSGLSPDEQIEVGESFKGFSSVLNQIISSVAEEKTPSE
ncbi:MAG TPA: hypothetical protein VMW67_03235 [Desulfobacteria bacterium]|nr:hypothetical protein [Desulfobacteria bacterium]